MEKEVITALFALVGAFFGALLSLEVARQKLVLEQLAANFAKFLESVEIAFRKATDVLHEQPEGAKRDIEIGDIYQSAQIQARVVRLYLSMRSKKEFWKLFREYRELHVQKNLGNKRIEKMDEKLERIQEIFEEHLEPSFWHTPVSTLCARLTRSSSRRAKRRCAA